MAQVKLNAAFPRVVAEHKFRRARAYKLTFVSYKLWPDSGNTTNPSRGHSQRVRHRRQPGNPQEQSVQNVRTTGGVACRSALVLLARAACRRSAQLAGALAAVALLTVGAAAQEGTVKAQHGDWQIVCKDPPPGAKNEVCALVQSVTAEDKDNIGLTVYFQKFSNGTRVLRVFAPLGILLPPGLGLKIDDKDVGHAPFLRCHTFACYAQVVVEDPLVEQLKTGKTAIFIIFQAEEAGIGIPISLAGFKEALAELK
jgi:invasion protein IalB